VKLKVRVASLNTDHVEYTAVYPQHTTRKQIVADFKKVWQAHLKELWVVYIRSVFEAHCDRMTIQDYTLGEWQRDHLPVNLKATRRAYEKLNAKDCVEELDPHKWRAITGTLLTDQNPATYAIFHFKCGCWFEAFCEKNKIKYQVLVGNQGWIETSIDKAVAHLNAWHNSEHVRHD